MRRSIWGDQLEIPEVVLGIITIGVKVNVCWMESKWIVCALRLDFAVESWAGNEKL